MAGSPRVKVMLLSTGKTQDDQTTGTFYTTYKNPRNTTDKLALKKFDPRAWNPQTNRYGMHAVFKEKKIPK